jgi:hypothetical protein
MLHRLALDAKRLALDNEVKADVLTAPQALGAVHGPTLLEVSEAWNAKSHFLDLSHGMAISSAMILRIFNSSSAGLKTALNSRL